MQAFILNALGQAYQLSGRPGQGVPLFRRHNVIREELEDWSNLSAGLYNLCDPQLVAGSLRESEASARRALAMTRDESDEFIEATSLYAGA